MNQYKHTKKVRRIEYFRTFITFFLIFALFTRADPYSWGEASRMAQIQSLVDHHSLIIDNSMFFKMTGDKYFFNHHFYSDKPPILALYAAPFYFLIKQIGVSFENHLRPAYYLVTLFSIGVLSALTLTIFKRILQAWLDVQDQWADLCTFVAGVGTLILPYSIVFNNHVPSGCLILIATYYIFSYKASGNARNVVYSGVFLSLAGSIDINCFLFIPAFLLIFSRQSFKAGTFFILSCVPITSVYLILNLYTSGSIMPPAMNAALWNYPGSAFNQENLSGLATHKNILDVFTYTFHMLIGNRGLFSHTPILLFSVIGVLVMYKTRSSSRFGFEYQCLLSASLIYITIYVLRTNNYSGGAFGIRWFASLMLILCLPIVRLEKRIQLSRILKASFFFTACLSIGFAIVGTYDPFVFFAENSLGNTLKPPNTVFENAKALVNLFSNNSSNPTKIKLLIGTFIIYLLFFQKMRKFMLKNRFVLEQERAIDVSKRLDL